MNTLHQIWVGNKRRPVEWMATWPAKNPGMEYRVWTEKDIEAFGLKNKDKYDYFMEQKAYDAACDIARVEILERLGGVYMDADAVCLQPIEHEWFMDKDFFAAYEYDRRVANGVIGSVAHHPILKDYVDRLFEATVVEPACYTVGGTMLTSCIDSHGADDKVVILPSYTFYPKWKQRGEIDGKVYARQMWATTKGLYEDTQDADQTNA